MIMIRRHFLNAPKRTHLPMLSGPLSKGQMLLLLLLLEEEEAERCSSRPQKTPEKGRAGEGGDAL